MLEQLIRKPTTFVTAVWIFQFVSLDIGHRHRKQNCYQRALRNPNQTGCHRGSSHNWSKEVTELKRPEPQSLAEALRERKRCLHIFWSKRPTPLHCDESLLVFDGILFDGNQICCQVLYQTFAPGAQAMWVGMGGILISLCGGWSMFLCH